MRSPWRSRSWSGTSSAAQPGSAAYTASEHAITGLTKSVSLDGRAHDIACGQIDIGSVRAEPTSALEHVADAVLYLAHLPLAANVQFLTLAATAMPLVGRG